MAGGGCRCRRQWHPPSMTREARRSRPVFATGSRRSARSSPARSSPSTARRCAARTIAARSKDCRNRRVLRPCSSALRVRDLGSAAEYTIRLFYTDAFPHQPSQARDNQSAPHAMPSGIERCRASSAPGRICSAYNSNAARTIASCSRSMPSGSSTGRCFGIGPSMPTATGGVTTAVVRSSITVASASMN